MNPGIAQMGADFPDGRPRLMRVTKLRSKGQKEGGKQMEIKFEDER